jgi:ketosteroid isomerase-like protein
MSEENVEVIRRIWSRWEEGPDQGDPGAAWDHGLAAPDATISPPREVPGWKLYTGRDGFLEFFDTWTEAFTDFKIWPQRFIDVGDDRVVLILKQSATGKESSARVELHFGIVFTLKAGQATAVEMYITPEQALEAVGLSE